MQEDVEIIPIAFDKRFIKDYARRLVNDPEIAIVELVSNCSDAGANFVEIDWPTDQYGDFTIRDNGTGMTYDEFFKIWNTLSYNRREHGNEIVFPSGNTESNRKLFGKNGKGRFSLFCFNDKYEVETSKDGERCVFRVQRQPDRRMEPIKIELLRRVEDMESSHETIISSCAFNMHIKADRLRDLIGCKFLADPSLKIFVNGTVIELTSLDDTDREIVETPLGEVEIYILDSGRGGRTSHPHGVAWHVDGKGVGNVDWRDPNRMYTLDARTTEAKRFTFIVVADILAKFVNSDWTAFEDSDETNQVLEVVSQHIQAKLDELFFEKRQERKQLALKENNKQLSKLPKSSNKRIEQNLDGIQTDIRTIDQKTLNAVVKFMANLEAASTGYELLFQLADVSSDDVNRLNEILRKWSIRDAEVVLDELGRRLKLIEKLEELVDQDADELHEIHPLFDNGLWIFGPEYESVEFTSNRSLATVVRTLLKDNDLELDDPLKRPDIVATSDSRIKTYSHDSFDDDHEVNGIAKVLIIELKRGGYKLRKQELRQVEDYAEAISASGNLVSNGKIICIALGSTVATDAKRYKVGDDEKIIVEPRTYQTVIRQAKARTFQLKRKIEEARLQS